MAGNRSWAYLAGAVVVLAVVTAAVWYPGLTGCHRAATESPATQPVVSVPAVAQEDGVYLYFSPRGRATEAIIEQLSQARETVLIQAYQFTSAAIARAVLDARKRGVQVTVILDPTQEGNRGPVLEGQTVRYSSALFLHNQGIPVYIDRRHQIAHDKIMLIDGRTIITGSFNFTTAAQESNAENLLILQNKPALYAAYERNFREHLKHSVRYEGRAVREPRERESAPSRPRSRSSRRPAPAR